MKHSSAPPFWFLAFLLSLPLFSETVYSPALPDIARELQVHESWVEHTLTVYLFGFSFGILFWGSISDRYGRKPSLLAGLGLYILGCVGCWASSSIGALMISRLIQALGGGACSVLGQSIARDAYHGADRTKAYAIVGFTIPVATALGPVVGGFVDEWLRWQANFILLTFAGAIAVLLSYKILKETRQSIPTQKPSFKKVALQLLRDPQEVTFVILIGCANGMIFSYYAEGPFYLINLLGMSPSTYGMTFLAIGAVAMPGRYISYKLSQKFSPMAVLKKGVQAITISSVLFMLLTFLFLSLKDIPPSIFISLTLGYMLTLVVSVGMILPNAMSLALEKHQNAIGTASSLFGFGYYGLISLVAMGMGIFHDGTLAPMPAYFCAMGLIMWVAFRFLLEKKKI